MQEADRASLPAGDTESPTLSLARTWGTVILPKNAYYQGLNFFLKCLLVLPQKSSMVRFKLRALIYNQKNPKQVLVYVGCLISRVTGKLFLVILNELPIGLFYAFIFS